MTSLVQRRGIESKLDVRVILIENMVYGSSTRFVAGGPLIRSEHKVYLWVKKIGFNGKIYANLYNGGVGTPKPMTYSLTMVCMMVVWYWVPKPSEQVLPTGSCGGHIVWSSPTGIDQGRLYQSAIPRPCWIGHCRVSLEYEPQALSSALWCFPDTLCHSWLSLQRGTCSSFTILSVTQLKPSFRLMVIRTEFDPFLSRCTSLSLSVKGYCLPVLQGYHLVFYWHIFPSFTRWMLRPHLILSLD